jgi:D-alanyl-D-alanine carboxypeptidase/D-alanyl-D-alanine-endopeptidase (penicillin-binding protein 4)
MVNDNLVDVIVTPGAKPGMPATVSIRPETSFVTFDGVVETSAEGSHPRVEVTPVGPRRFHLKGNVPPGHKPIAKIYEVDDPSAFARTLLIEALRDQGIAVSASSLADNSTASLPSRAEVAKLPSVAEYTSPPFREYAKVILKVSHNLHASTLPLLVAAHHGDRTLESGLKREGAILKDLGVSVDTIAFGGGAGGARADLVTPRATVSLLLAMSKRPDYPAFEAALPVLGRDGTLAQAVGRDSPARGHAHAKTGTYWVSNGLEGPPILTSKALAGYLETSSGRPLVFAFFLNNVPLKGDDITDATTAAGKVLGKLCEVFYSE